MRPRPATERSRRRALAVGSLLLASVFGVAMVAFRVAYSGSGEYRNLPWNLLLAWVPFVLGVAIYDLHRRGIAPWRLAPAALLWLLFLPNAPYLVTDFAYLQQFHEMPVWYDITLLTTFAWLGLLLGFVSLYLMHVVAERLVGPVVSWIAAAAVLALTGFGVYLGRFARWNSWDVLADPARIGAELWSGLTNPLSHPRTLAVTVALGTFLLVGYIVTYSIARLAAADPGRPVD